MKAPAFSAVRSGYIDAVCTTSLFARDSPAGCGVVCVCLVTNCKIIINV
jgi:hypothetical protein